MSDSGGGGPDLPYAEKMKRKHFGEYRILAEIRDRADKEVIPFPPSHFSIGPFLREHCTPVIHENLTPFPENAQGFNANG